MHYSPPSLNPTFYLRSGGGEAISLFIYFFFRKTLPTLFCPHPLTNCHTNTSRLVSGGGNGGSWKFPFADQSKGYTISGLLAKPQEGQTGPWGLGVSAAPPQGASTGMGSGFSCLRCWGGSQSLGSHFTVPGSLLQPYIPDLEAGRGHGSGLLAGASQPSSADLLTPGLGCNHNPAPHNQNSRTEPPPSSRRLVSDPLDLTTNASSQTKKKRILSFL